ncbi:putative odorant receptor 19b [Pectinophora gossypiella]|uniref:putative odorant receptor 19b n=1 Tax=Pectinophora gossypiella TaxID=13191 RepID=UPI00214F5C78|nr:putative odorant receptor 19b [Pectinophora gossypiella]
MSDANHEIPSYIPFDTSTWNSFCLANILDKCTVFWIGYSYFTIDVLIGNYYALARVQLRIINYNLERLFHPYQRDTDSFSMSFIYLIIFYLFMQFQIIVYCFFAGFVDHESRFVATSVYMSDWQSLSPRFRRLLAIAMTRWIIPITPKVSGVIPLSPATFVTVTRAAYTLYTVLKGKNDGDRTLAF